MKPCVIAIDGPAASGKGSLGRRIAAHLGFVYLDTGRLYRAVGLQLMESGLGVHEAADHASKSARHAITCAQRITLSILNSLDKFTLGSETVGEAASLVSAIPKVREALPGFQRQVAASPQGAVLDGRDIGTVICPDAPFKFYVTASLETRAKRRFKELQSQGNPVIYESVLQDLKARDERDSKRAIAPLKPAEDAIRVDTTDLGMDEVFEKVLNTILSSASNHPG